jgi:hypothetical protein
MFHIKNILNRMMSSSSLAGMGFAAFLLVSAPVSAQVSPNLGVAGTYSILAGTQVTNTGTAAISGDVGISPGAGAPGANHPGLTAGMVVGTIHDGDVPAANAQFAQSAAYTALDLNNGCTVTYAGAFKDLVGLTLVPGVYCTAAEFRLSGTLILSGLASDTWVFKSGGGLTITGTANVVSPSCNVWWRVVSTATFGPSSSLKGNILADTSITMDAGATLSGRAFARTAEVTLIGNAITACLAAPTPIPTPTPTPPTPTPIPPTPTPIPPTPTPIPPTPTPIGGGATLSTVASPGVTLGAAIFDTATLSFGAAPTGTITFSLYGPNDPICDTTAIFTSAAIVNHGNGIYTSASTTPLVIGTYRWRAGYSGDANNAATLTACADVSESVIISAAISPAAGIPTLSGWGLMTLMVLIGLVGVASIHRLTRI